ncbi:hypothetical protein BX616_002638 [Lobosporangium transversale]|uniref:non-specific serine/threonine protein kinase n=1 Tax=Lobosporangium transversale TaxID=64571 RepID=A0A1Y2G8U1_9FUNG|nr:hypothetical protein BCR41DRAFT_425937 [Lobosporangium transversale]KAF9916849.1 hypothetical protein BX616_002638 [Lobosporangium transversale]ORZ04434.1 hypothetical protein BCR41DRAFT_425937 [Lobosporangium transversale]|eukprot:XP_021876542.1 hypothetical protein BCR41DRAFT_425937 [Lobosporangium transversale]
MHAPASLRSKQSVNPPLKRTYGKRSSQSKQSILESSTPYDRTQFNWDRLEKERKARIERIQAHRAHHQRLQAPETQNKDSECSSPSSSDFETAVAKASLLYSDPVLIDDDDELTLAALIGSDNQGERSNIQNAYSIRGLSPQHSAHSLGRRQLSSFETAHTHWIDSSYDNQGSMTNICSAQDSGLEVGPLPLREPGGGATARSYIRQPTPLRPKDIQSSLVSGKRTEKPLPSTMYTRLDLAAQRKVIFQEKAFFAERDSVDDQDSENEDESDSDEVLFRTPSFHILQRMKELPKLRVPEPRVNPFGFQTLVEPEESEGTNTIISGRPAASDLLPDKLLPSEQENPFLESPNTKKSMDILNRRAQQLREVELRRKYNNMNGLISAEKDGELSLGSRLIDTNIMQSTVSELFSVNMGLSKYEQPSTPPKVSSRIVTQESQRLRDDTVQDDCVDIALGKRMSSIEITPQRLFTKQRKTSPSSPSNSILSLFPASPSLSDLEESESYLDDDTPPKPIEPLLSSDIPAVGQEDRGVLWKTAALRQRVPDSFSSSLSSSSSLSLFPSLSSSLLSLPSSVTELSLSQEAKLHPSAPQPLPRLYRHKSSLVAPRRSQLTKVSRHSPSKHGVRIESGREPQLHDLPHTACNPFRDVTNQNILEQPSCELKDPSQNPLSSIQQHSLPISTVFTQPLLQQQQLERKIRSLRRPPAVLTSIRKSIFQPTMDDLISICDQEFFTQFHGLDDVGENQDGERSDGSKASLSSSEARNGHGILDFDSLLPKRMLESLTKIGEATYSEVYTVELPIQKQAGKSIYDYDHRLRDHSSYNDSTFFQSPRLNAYIKESMKDDLLSIQSIQMKPKLVMKVIPFNSNRENGNENGDGSVSGSRGRRTRGVKPETESTELLLEDIYREVMVSTQIMHGWKGFIGSFGALVVRGRYPKTFLSAWNQFRRQNGTESERPDKYTKDQLYCIILLPYGGIDLEHCPLANWQQAWSILAQVAASLESKEQAPFWFEHRDLHWGNILVKDTSQERLMFPMGDSDPILGHDLNGLDDAQSNHNPAIATTRTRVTTRSIPTFGIIVQMIDFTLARVQGNKGNLIYMDLEKDQEFFRGQGDYQYDIYRKMQKALNKDWAASCPRTNLFWLHYIADKLLTKKCLKKPIKQSAITPATTAVTSITYPQLRASMSVKRTSRLASSLSLTGVNEDIDNNMTESWCYERVLAVSKMNLDQLELSGQTPMKTVLDILFPDQS